MSDRLVIVESESSSVVLRGEIDAHSAPALAGRFETLPAGDDDVVIDMSEVTFMDSSGLRVLIDLHERLAATSRRLVIGSPSQPVTRLLEVAGLADHFAIGH
jgi:anti-sigma B factor antagonist